MAFRAWSTLPSSSYLVALKTPCSGLGAYTRLSHRRTIFNLFRKPKPDSKREEQEPIISQDNLFHPFSQSPFQQIRARGEAIKKLAPCPVCASADSHIHAHTKVLPRAVKFECPNCGWPTHCSEEHWREDEEHDKYCSRLREANEDDHDLRSGRKLREFELPGPQAYEEAVSFSNWDVFWYTRGFPSMDTERFRRHASKLLTYPITIGSVLHQYSNLTLSNQRLTPEGSRSLAALRSTLHVPPGAPDSQSAGVLKPSVRIFILGARGESALPPHVWEQLNMLFPSAHIHLFFIGPQVSLPKSGEGVSQGPSSEPAAIGPEDSSSSAESSVSSPTSASRETDASAEITSSSDEANETSHQKDSLVTSSATIEKREQSTYLPNVYEPPTPAPIMKLKRTRSSLDVYGVPSYTNPYAYELTITGLQATYLDVHAQFQETYDPYTDCFFFFAPGFGFPSPKSVSETGEPLLQIASPTEWGPVLPALLATKCPIFVTGFSPADIERDVRSLSTAPDVAGEFEWVITPGPNAFGSEKWEIADFDPRVMVKANWGIWGIRGKTREVRERYSSS